MSHAVQRRADVTRRWSLSAGVVVLLCCTLARAQTCRTTIDLASARWRDSRQCVDLDKIRRNLASIQCAEEAEKNDLRSLQHNVDASWRSQHCSECALLRATIAKYKKADLAQTSCSEVLQVKRQVEGPSTCREKELLTGRSALAARVEARVASAECSTFCRSLVSRLDVWEKDPATRSEDPGPPTLLECNLDATQLARCRKLLAQTPASVGNDAKLLADLRDELTTMNNDIRKDPKCQTPDGCPKKESERVDKLTAYLELLRVSHDAQEHSRAKGLLRGVGLPGNILEIVNNNDPVELAGAAALRATIGNPELSKLLAGDLAKKNLKGLAQLVQDGEGLERLLQEVQRLDPEARRRFFHSAGRLGLAQNAMRAEYWKQVAGGDLLEAFFPAESGQCSECSEFLNTLENELTVGEARQVTRVTDVKTARDGQIAARQPVCAGTADSSVKRVLGCGPILTVELKPDGKERAQGTATVTFISPAPQSKAVVTNKELPIEPFSTRPSDLREQVAAAQNLADRLAFAYNALRNQAVVEQHILALRPNRHCGVTITVDGAFQSPPSSMKGLVLNGKCQAPALIEGFRATVASFDAIGSTTTLAAQQPPTKVKVPMIEFDHRRDEHGIEKCMASLLFDGAPVYSMAAFVNSSNGDCKDDMPTRWRHAGEELAMQLGVYIAQPASSSPPPTATSLPPWWHAGFVSGARQLEASSGRSGWGWAAADVGLIAAGVVFTQLSINARNNAIGTGEVGNSNLFLGLGLGSFALVIPLRITSGLMCCD